MKIQIFVDRLLSLMLSILLFYLILLLIIFILIKNKKTSCITANLINPLFVFEWNNIKSNQIYGTEINRFIYLEIYSIYLINCCQYECKWWEKNTMKKWKKLEIEIQMEIQISIPFLLDWHCIDNRHRDKRKGCR